MDKKMSRAYALKMLEILIEKDLENPITFDDIKNVKDNTKYETSDNEREAFLKSELICHLFKTLPYYTIEDYTMTLSIRLVSLARNYDGYNATSCMLSATLRDIITDINRRVEIEIFHHILMLSEMYYRDFEIFSQKSGTLILRNVCKTELLSSLDIAEGYNYEQINLPGITFALPKTSEEISKTNYIRKDNIRRRVKEFIVSNYSDETYGDLVDNIYKTINESNASTFDKRTLKDLYEKVLKKVYTSATEIWFSKEANKEYNQLQLFD